MKRKIVNRILSIPVMAATILAFTSCNKNKNVVFTPRLDTNQAVNLNVIGFFSNFESFDQVTNDFNEYYPNVSFSYQQVASGKVKDYINKNSNIDIFMTGSDNFIDGDDDLLKYCLDLSKSDINLNDIDENMLKPNYKDNILHSIPIGKNVYGIIVNKTLLEKNGLEIPTNFDEFKNSLEVLHNNGYTPIQGPETKVMPELTINMMSDYLIENKDDSLTAKYQKIDEIFTIIDYMIDNNYTDFTINKEYPYDNYDKAILRFFDGNVPFWICNSEKVSGMKKRESKSEAFKNSPFEYTYIYAPLGKDGAYVYEEPWYGFSIYKESDNLELCKEFMRFYATKNEINKMADIKGIPSIAKNPSTTSIYNNINKVDKIQMKSINDGTISANVVNDWYSMVNKYVKKEITKEEAINNFLKLNN